MSKKNIGTHAGMVWGLLCDGRKWNYDELRDKLRLRDRDLNAALGWLAREDKIEFEHEGGSTQEPTISFFNPRRTQPFVPDCVGWEPSPFSAVCFSRNAGPPAV